MPYSAADVRARDWILRGLVCGPPKSGKTVLAACTSPPPVFMANTDGEGALDPAVQFGADFEAEDIKTHQDVINLTGFLKANAKNYGTVVIDNITGIASILEERARQTVDNPDGRAVYGEYGRHMMKFFYELIRLPCNLLILGHVDEAEPTTGGFGKILAVPGRPKVRIPALIQDWMWLDVRIDSQTNQVSRHLLLAPQGGWTAGARSIRGVPSIEIGEDLNRDGTAKGIEKFIALVQQDRAKYTRGKSSMPIKQAPKPNGQVVSNRPVQPVRPHQQPIRK